MAGERATADFDATKTFAPTSVAPAQTAVLLMDYHNMIVGMCGEEAGATVAVAASLREWALAKGMSVYHCLIDMSGTSPPSSSKMAGRFGSLGQALKEKPELADEPAALTIQSDNSAKEKVVTRRPGTVSALCSDTLLEQLQAANVKSLVITGLSSSGVTLSTTRDATDRGYIVTVVEDGCADRVPGCHEMLMQNVLPMTAHVAPFKDVQAAWK